MGKIAVKPAYSDVLAERYATPEMIGIWTAKGKIILERRLWIALLEAQRDLGVPVADGAVEAYRKNLKRVRIKKIRERELRSKHDVKVRIEEFCELAGYEEIHKGMTSRDLTDNVEQLQIYESLALIRDKLVAVMSRLGNSALEHQRLAMVGRSHNVAAQMVTFGKRLAMYGDDLHQSFGRLEYLMGHYPLRGIKGPMGTCQDQLELLGSPKKVLQLEQAIAGHLGFSQTFDCVGQIYPRSLDGAVVHALIDTASALANMATTFRLMAGYELLVEGFKEGQVGSSAMPHKINPRTCERICALLDVLSWVVSSTQKRAA